MKIARNILLKVAFAFVIVILMASCTTVRFMEPQPANKRELSSFPNRYLGKYTCDNQKDTLIVYKNSFILSNELYSLNSEDVVLKKFKGYKVISLRNPKTSQAWEVFLTTYKSDTISIYAIQFDGKSERDHIHEQLKNMLDVQNVYKENGNIDFFLINPTKRQLKTIIKKDIFTIQCKYHKMK